jgi:wobble nucleotide-excising tRNase
MKDKRTYTKAKEHGEDMSHENEVKIEPGALPWLIEEHKKEIWKYQQKESEHIKTQNELENAKEIIKQLSSKIVEQNNTITVLEKARNDLAAELKNK